VLDVALLDVVDRPQSRQHLANVGQFCRPGVCVQLPDLLVEFLVEAFAVLVARRGVRDRPVPVLADHLGDTVAHEFVVLVHTGPSTGRSLALAGSSRAGASRATFPRARALAGMSDRAAFLAGERPEDVLLYFSEAATDGIESLVDHGERVEGGAVLVVDGEQGRGAFQAATGVDPMGFAKEAMANPGTVDPDCTGGVCPNADDEPDDPHEAEFAFAFAEEQNEDVDGLYQEGDVVHAYVRCSCGASYGDKWLAGERE
jgi:hypothetical protein